MRWDDICANHWTFELLPQWGTSSPGRWRLSLEIEGNLVHGAFLDYMTVNDAS